jgi:hypothetical protein
MFVQDAEGHIWLVRAAGIGAIISIRLQPGRQCKACMPKYRGGLMQ